MLNFRFSLFLSHSLCRSFYLFVYITANLGGSAIADADIIATASLSIALDDFAFASLANCAYCRIAASSHFDTPSLKLQSASLWALIATGRFANVLL